MSAKLYSHPVCPFAHRSRLALRLKGVDYETVDVDLKDMPQWFLDISPNQKVPLLEHEGQRLWESAIINEYVEEAFSGTSLLPADPYLRARARLALDWAGNQFIPLFYKALRGEVEGAAEQLEAVQAGLEATMVGSGPFWVGDQPSLADIGIYPWFERSVVLKHYHGLELNSSRLKSWKETMQSLPAVQREMGDPKLYIDTYARYAPAKV